MHEVHLVLREDNRYPLPYEEMVSSHITKLVDEIEKMSWATHIWSRFPFHTAPPLSCMTYWEISEKAPVVFVTPWPSYLKKWIENWVFNAKQNNNNGASIAWDNLLKIVIINKNNSFSEPNDKNAFPISTHPISAIYPESVIKAVKTIEKWWHDNYYDPKKLYCKKRLLKMYSELPDEMKTVS